MFKKTDQDLFLDELKKIKGKYDKERLKDRFNIFYALHKENDEVNLHSRFISYLLDNKAGHNQRNLFAKLFFEKVLKIDGDNFLNEYEVIPNEINKTEFKEIDILLVNKNKKHAIIIENKIYAKDGNHIGKKTGYNGQLERYYNTILKGVPEENSEKSSNNNFKSHKYISKKIDVFYLTLNKPNENNFKQSKLNLAAAVSVRYYNSEIIEWLKACTVNTKSDEFLNKIINQYLILVKNMTKTNIPKEERTELSSLFSEHLESAQYFIDNFKHVKWHTLDSFLQELEGALNGKKYLNVRLYPENDKNRAELITKSTHFDQNENIGVLFDIPNKETFYISTQNNLSWGKLDSEEWSYFNSHKLQHIRFSDFSTENTFNLINEENRKKVIALIIEEIPTN